MEGMLLTAATNFDVSFLLEMGTSVLTWVITSWGSLMTFVMTHTAILVFVGLSLVGGACKFLRKWW